MSDYLHTQAGIETLNLPGYRSVAEVGDVFGGENDWQPLLSLTIFRDADDGLELLTGVRREDVNPTHPGVVSTPTKRLPKAIAELLFKEKQGWLEQADLFRLEAIDPTHPEVVGRFIGNSEPIPDNSSILPFVTADLLARKLGLAEALEGSSADNPLGSVSIQSVLAGFSNATADPETGEHLFEPLIVFGAVAKVDRPEDIPSITSSYRNISWVPIGDFIEGVDGKNAPLLIEGLTPEDEISVCVRGLCLATSRSNVIDASSLSTHINSGTLNQARQAA